MTQAYEAIRKLLSSDALDNFDCNQPALNEFLQRYSLVS